MGTITAQQGAGLSDKVYNDLSSYVGTKKTVSDGFGGLYTVSAFYTDPSTDLQMALLQVGTTYVVAFRGTYSWTDAGTDLQMGVSTITSTLADQFISASTTFSMWEALYGLSTNNTTIVGHSLGGSLAQYFGADGFTTLTYNAYGVSNMSQVGGNSRNIPNYPLHVTQTKEVT